MSRTVSFAERDDPGRLVAFCGIDGAGKSTLIARTADRLRCAGRNVHRVAVPSARMRAHPLFVDLQTDPRPEVRARVSFLAFSLAVMADRLQQSHEVIQPLLDAGAWVLADRYAFTGLAEAVARDQAHPILYLAADLLPRPDHVFLVDVDPAAAIRRIRSRPAERDAYLDPDLMGSMAEAFRGLARDHGMVVVDNNDGRLEESWEAVMTTLGPDASHRGSV